MSITTERTSMGISDLLRRLSNTIFGWPKIDESNPTIPTPTVDTAVIVEGTPLSTYAPLILLSLMHDPEGLPGSKITQDIGNVLREKFTSKDIVFCQTDYGFNFHWTQTVRSAAKELASRNLIVIEGNDVWRILSLGYNCGKRIHDGENEAWLDYRHVNIKQEDPHIEIEFVQEPKPYFLIPEICKTYDAADYGNGKEFDSSRIVGTQLIDSQNISVPLPCPCFFASGVTEEGLPYHKSSDVNVIALWFALYDYKDAVPADLAERVSTWCEEKLTATDNEMLGGRTKFKRHIANLTYDLKRQKLIAYHVDSDRFHVTQKGFTLVVDYLNEHGYTSCCPEDH